MSAVQSYPHGTFSWIDLSTTDAAAAKTFYTSLFGWTVIDNPIPGGTYTMFLLEGKNVCALSQMSEEQMAQGMPSMWNSYISVDDVEATTAKVADLGGTVIAPSFDVMDAGRMSVIQDPTGAFVSLWETVNHRGADTFNVPNTHSWNELATRDTAGAEAFYKALLGWGSVTDENGYTMWTVGERGNGGMMAMDENWPAEVPPHWGVYFSVSDINAAVESVKSLGGSVRMGPFDGGEVGQMALVADPTGAGFTLIQMNQADETMPGG